MKTIAKTTYIPLVCAFILSSCGQEYTTVDIPDGSDRRILFRTSLPEVATRAVQIATEGNLSAFQVTVFDESDSTLIAGGKLKEYIFNQLVEKDYTGRFISDSCQWPKPGLELDTLHFFGYYLDLNGIDSLENATSVSADREKVVGFKVRGFEVAHDIENQVDFMTAYTTGSMADNYFTGVNLNFEHQLSRIEVKAWGAHKSCDIEIAGVRIGGIVAKGDFEFNSSEENPWSIVSKGIIEYIYHEGDTTLMLSRKKELHNSASKAASVMGAPLGEDLNCALLIPTKDMNGWDFGKDRKNENNQMYISVLMRITDANGNRQYPYPDTNQGKNALDIPIIYLAVDEETGSRVTQRVYKGANDKYFIDEDHTTEYQMPQTEIVKEYSWAAVPVKADWEAGKIYTYTLDYTYGIGLHDPSVGDAGGAENYLKAGDPVISDRVGVSLGFKDWTKESNTGIEVPGN